MVLGVLVIVLLFLGFPAGWEQTLAVILGLLIVWLSYKLQPTGVQADKSSGAAASYTEHRSMPPEAKPSAASHDSIVNPPSA